MTSEQTMVFRKTNTQCGRHISVTPANSANRHLSYGRIALRDGVDAAQFSTGVSESGLIVLDGGATVIVDGERSDLSQYDGIYIPRDASVEVVPTHPPTLRSFQRPSHSRIPCK
jgi:hypothetical protein